MKCNWKFDCMAWGWGGDGRWEWGNTRATRNKVGSYCGLGITGVAWTAKVVRPVDIAVRAGNKNSSGRDSRSFRVVHAARASHVRLLTEVAWRLEKPRGDTRCHASDDWWAAPAHGFPITCLLSSGLVYDSGWKAWCLQGLETKGFYVSCVSPWNLQARKKTNKEDQGFGRGQNRLRMMVS